ncbi:uncharacterized protein [Aegilops tauschii subsp. strangulata]|nr:shematrin-like protein 2 [Aegilops tauschii subsp. strangulata]
MPRLVPDRGWPRPLLYAVALLWTLSVPQPPSSDRLSHGRRSPPSMRISPPRRPVALLRAHSAEPIDHLVPSLPYLMATPGSPHGTIPYHRRGKSAGSTPSKAHNLEPEHEPTMAGVRRAAALLLLLGLACTPALAARDAAQAKPKHPSGPAAGKKPAKPYVPPATKPPGSGGVGGGGGMPNIPGIGTIPGFTVPGMGGGWGGGYGGPDGGYSRGGVAASTTVCSEKGPCYKKKLTCPKKCFSSYSGSGKGYGGGGGGGGCTVDCKTKCVAYC